MTYKIIDLFCGIGGVRRGFEQAGCKCVLSADIDKRAIKQYKHLFNEDCFNDVTSEEFKNKCNIDYDILCGGFPCQAFSIAGARRGFLDEAKGTLFFDCADILQRTRPKAFLFENVYGLLNHDKGKTFNTIFKILTDLDYKLVGFTDFQQYLGCVSFQEMKTILRYSKDFGIPQKRPRIYIVGFDKKRYNDKLKDYYDLPRESGREIFSFNDIIDNEGDFSEYYFSKHSYEMTINREKKHGRKGEFMCIPTNCFMSLTTKYNTNRLPCDFVKCKDSPSGWRFLTDNEGARLQGFKDYAFMENGVDKFTFEPTLTKHDKAFILGNSVTIPVIEEIAKFMVKELERLDEENN